MTSRIKAKRRINHRSEDEDAALLALLATGCVHYTNRNPIEANGAFRRKPSPLDSTATAGTEATG